MARRKVRIKPKFYLFLTVALCCLGGLLALILRDPSGGALQAGSMTAKLEVKAVLVRDEMCVSVDKYDRVAFDAREGETIYQGMPVAKVYKWGYSDDMTQALLTVEGEIYAAQKAQLAGVENAELTNIELQLEQKRLAIRSLMTGVGEGNLLTLQRELAALMEQRGAFLKNTVQSTEALTQLYAEEESRREQLAAYRTDVVALEDGVVSFYFDGYEQIFNCDKLDTVNASLITATLSGAADSLGGASDNLLYRLVNPKQWYAAFVTAKNESLRLAAGESYTVSFEGYGDGVYTGRAVEAALSDGGVANLLEFADDVGPLLSARVVKATISAPMEGLVIPLDALSVKDGVVSATVADADGEYAVEVEVLATDGERALIRAKNEAEALSAGMRYTKP